MKLRFLLLLWGPYMVLLLCAGCGAGRKKTEQSQTERSQTERPQAEQPETEQSPELSVHKPNKQIKQMTVDEAIEAASYYESVGHQDLLIATYQHIIAKSQNPDIVAAHIIKLADLYLGDNNFAEAKKFYKKVISLYPGYQGIERARYREVLVHFLSALGPTRDQSATQGVIKLGKSYLSDFSTNERSCSQIKSMIKSAYQRILASELLILNFYLNKFAIKSTATSSLRAAWMRTKGIVKKLLPQMLIYVPRSQEAIVEIDFEDQEPDFELPDIQEKTVAKLTRAAAVCMKLQDELDSGLIVNSLNLRNRF